MVKELISAIDDVSILYWYSNEKKFVKMEGKNKTHTIYNKLTQARNSLLGYEESEIKKIVNKMSIWIKSLDESYEINDKIDDDKKKELDDEAFEWINTLSSVLLNKYKLLKNTTDIFNELRATRDTLTKMGEKSEMEEVRSLLADINKSAISLLFSTPTRRTFEPKLRGITSSTKNGPVYMAGYFDQDLLPELLEMTDNVELRILSPELKNSRQDNVNKDALERLHKKGAKIKVHPMLHARFVVTPIEGIVGSADIKSDCLGGRRYDLCIYTNNPMVITDLREFASDIWSEAKNLF